LRVWLIKLEMVAVAVCDSAGGLFPQAAFAEIPEVRRFLHGRASWVATDDVATLNAADELWVFVIRGRSASGGAVFSFAHRRQFAQASLSSAVRLYGSVPAPGTASAAPPC